eukprot:8901877-Pyramimonas_sp.AAC.2
MALPGSPGPSAVDRTETPCPSQCPPPEWHRPPGEQHSPRVWLTTNEAHAAARQSSGPSFACSAPSVDGTGDG